MKTLATLDTVGIQDVKRQYSYLTDGEGLWFSVGTMRFFRTRLSSTAYKTNDAYYFISSEQFNSEALRLYSLRKLDKLTGSIDTVGDFQQFKSIRAAKQYLLNII